MWNKIYELQWKHIHCNGIQVAIAAIAAIINIAGMDIRKALGDCNRRRGVVSTSYGS